MERTLSGPATLKQDLLAFFAERVRTLLEASAYGFAYDEIAAAMEAGWASSLTDLVDRITAVKAMRNEPNFLSILDSAKRIANITAGQETTSEIDPSKLESDVERRLAGLASTVGKQIEEMIAERDYKRALETFAAMAPELEDILRRSHGHGRGRGRATQPDVAAAQDRRRGDRNRRRHEDRRRPA